MSESGHYIFEDDVEKATKLQNRSLPLSCCNPLLRHQTDDATAFALVRKFYIYIWIDPSQVPLVESIPILSRLNIRHFTTTPDNQMLFENIYFYRAVWAVDLFCTAMSSSQYRYCI